MSPGGQRTSRGKVSRGRSPGCGGRVRTGLAARRSTEPLACPLVLRLADARVPPPPICPRRGNGRCGAGPPSRRGEDQWGAGPARLGRDSAPRAALSGLAQNPGRRARGAGGRKALRSPTPVARECEGWLALDAVGAKWATQPPDAGRWGGGGEECQRAGLEPWGSEERGDQRRPQGQPRRRRAFACGAQDTESPRRRPRPCALLENGR